MKRPAFQFYPADWRNNAKLRRCSWEARGVWIELLGLLHDSDDYGVLAWPLKEIAQALGAPLKALKELVEKGVLYGVEKGSSEPFIYRPVSGRVTGEAVELLPAVAGPVWFSPRMVRDEYVRTKRGENTRFSAGDTPSPKPPKGESKGGAPKAAPHQRQGDGASSSSSSTTSVPNGTTVAARQRFEMHEGWQPDEVSLITQLRLAGLAASAITDAGVLEFIGFWITRNVADTQGGWCNRLVKHAKSRAVHAAANPSQTTDSGNWAEKGVRL
jgi:hypothetical protein